MAIDFDTLVLKPCMDNFGEINQGYPLPVYTPKEGARFSIDGVFDKAYKENAIQEGQIVTIEMPVFGSRQTQFKIYPKQGDEIQIRGRTYYVREVRPDGHGHLKLMLNVAADYNSSDQPTC